MEMFFLEYAFYHDKASFLWYLICNGCNVSHALNVGRELIDFLY